MIRSSGLTRTLGGAILLIALVILCSGIAVVLVLDREEAALEARRASHETVRDIGAFRMDMLDQETGVRGFLITGRETSLQPYTSGREAFDRLLPHLHSGTSKDVGEDRLLGEAIAAARAWQEEIGETILRDAADPATRDAAMAIERDGRGKRFFDAFRQRLQAIEASEKANADRQNALATSWHRWLQIAIWLAAFVVLLICAGVAWFIHRSVASPLSNLAAAMRRLARREPNVEVPALEMRNEVGGMARAVQVFKDNIVELDRTSLLRATADTLPAMVGYVDAGRRVGLLNSEFARFFDLGGDDVARWHGLGLSLAFPNDAFPGSARELDVALRGAETRFEHHLMRRDGSGRDFEAFYRPHFAPDGAVLGVVTLLTDVTETKETERALMAARDAAEGANRAKSAFLANMSHELRTPLSAVIGYTELLEEDAEDGGDTAVLSDLAKIKANAKHLLGLINDILDLSKVEANKMELIVEEIDLPSFLRDAAGTVEALVGRKANTLVVDVADDFGTMRTDGVKLRQCLFNLLGNAAKFTENGTITLSARRAGKTDGDWIAFDVRDDGIGMTQEQLSRLFQRFTQADETTTRKFGGTGLGLALSRAFARLMGGDIAVASEPGRGTTFTIELPSVLPESRLEVIDDISLPTASHDQRGALVLVIDDEASQRELMKRFLERQGFTVRTAGSGGKGIELARMLRPRAVLLDVMMPGMDGWAVLKALKADAETSHIPVVMVSFVADAGISASLGAVDAVPKPIDWMRLKGVLDKLNRDAGDVLVVDDDDDMRERLRAVLERHGWSVREAGDGAGALEAVRAEAPQLVLLDLTMPVMDGFVFLETLRRLPEGADVPVLVLTARDVSLAERERLHEAAGILKKGETSLRDISTEVRKLARGAADRKAMPGPLPLDVV